MKTITFSAYEDIVIGLVNATHCKECNQLYYYNGLTPRSCPKGHVLEFWMHEMIQKVGLLEQQASELGRELAGNERWEQLLETGKSVLELTAELIRELPQKV